MFITFEGIEGCGKTTQIKRLADFLIQKKIDVLLTREPGGAPIAEQIRDVLLDKNNFGMDAKCELLLYYASRAEHLAKTILPALKQNKLVLCDRFYDASMVYQSDARGIDTNVLLFLNSFVVAQHCPNFTFLFDLPVVTGLARAKSRASQELNSEDRLEQESLIFHEKVRQGYLCLAKQNPQRFSVLNAEGSIEEIWQQLLITLYEKGIIAP